MTLPALFVSHGAPTAALDDDGYTRALAAWALGTPRPQAVVVVSPHWETRGPVRVNAAARPPLIYDFTGFPPALYELRYPAPGGLDLAREVAAAFAEAGLEPVEDGQRGWDHGVWVPLRLLYPAADVPVVEVSLPEPRTPDLLLAMGRALAPLRDHLDPVFFVLGARDDRDRVDSVYEGFRYGTLSLRSFAFATP